MLGTKNGRKVASSLVFAVAFLMAPVAALAQSPFKAVITRLADLGFFEFVLPFLLSATIFYGLLRKSKLFGDPQKNVAVNAIVALIAGFMVWAYPILAGVDVTLSLTTFFFQGMIVMLTIIIGLLIAGMFMPEDLPQKIGEAFKGGKGLGLIIVGSLLVGLVIFITSGVVNILFPGFSLAGFGGGGINIGGSIDSTTILSIITIVVMGAIVMGIVWGGPKSK